LTEPASAGFPVDVLRRTCLSLPEVTERISHGEPAWFVRKKMFASLSDHHHDDRLAVWCAAAPGAQDVLVDAQPEQFFVPPYVGHRGWLGVRLDRGIDTGLLEDLIIDAYRAVAPAALTSQIPLSAGA
jgi:hypothetical protein